MSIEDDVRMGLLSPQKWLPPYLFYDEIGSQLFEQVTQLPEYYVTRTERDIFIKHAPEIMRATFDSDAPCSILELGAASASKTQILLSALAKRCQVRFFPVDVEAKVLDECVSRFATEEPSIEVSPVVGLNDDALSYFKEIPPKKAVFFIGSSIGNLSDEEAIALLTQIRGALSVGEALVLGADRKKDLALLLPAYDDSQGITAAFNKNILSHLNHRLQANFDISQFAHRATWSEARSCIEIHLVSLCSQQVALKGLSLEINFSEGETIHTESCAKYDDARIDKIFHASSFIRGEDFFDERRWFGVHVARAV
jgi:L-histidine Nalpha-methyltransferase